MRGWRKFYFLRNIYQVPLISLLNPHQPRAGNKHMLGEILKLYVKLCGKRMDKIEEKSGLMSQ